MFGLAATPSISKGGQVVKPREEDNAAFRLRDGWGWECISEPSGGKGQRCLDNLSGGPGRRPKSKVRAVICGIWSPVRPTQRLWEQEEKFSEVHTEGSTGETEGCQRKTRLQEVHCHLWN